MSNTQPTRALDLRPGDIAPVDRTVCRVTFQEDGNVLVEFKDGFPPVVLNPDDAIPAVKQ